MKLLQYGDGQDPGGGVLVGEGPPGVGVTPQTGADLQVTLLQLSI